MKLTLVRHGETIENVNHIIMGQMPGELTERGIQQAKDTAEKLKNEKFDAIYCSDLKRCTDTAGYIRAFHKDTPFIITEKLRERFSASYQGKVFDKEYWNSLPGIETTRKYEGGESWLDVKNRLPAFINEVYEQHKNDHILMVAHGGILRGAISIIENRPLADVPGGDDIPNGVALTFEINSPLPAGPFEV